MKQPHYYQLQYLAIDFSLCGVGDIEAKYNKDWLLVLVQAFPNLCVDRFSHHDNIKNVHYAVWNYTQTGLIHGHLVNSEF